MTLFDDPPAEPPPPASEEQVKADVLAYLEAEYAPLLDWLRRGLVRIYRFRLADVGVDAAEVSADDARALLPRYPGEKPACNNVLGSLFRAPGWHWTGRRIKSRTPGSHSNELKTWKYTGPLADGGPYGRGPEDTAPKRAT
jgi:hypothetical protein